MRKITIKNNFSNRQTWIDADRPFTVQRINRIRARLTSPGCQSGDILGARGPQENPIEYCEVMQRAIIVVLGGQE